MADQGALFEQDDETFTVSQVTTRLHRAVADAFPAEVWVRGEVDGLRPPTANGHVYLSLSEKARGRDSSTLQAVLLRQSRVRIERALAAHPSFRLADGIEVRVRGRVQFGYGRVQLVVSEVDPVHTLGRQAAERDRVLGALAGEGLLERNGRRALPMAPLHIGLVTSDGSAACQDVVHELEASGLGFRITVADARVQGHGAEASILAALAHALAFRPDVVLLVRGGGARTDLATFDGERIARAIAGALVPVLTGIGHEIDTSVADAVAHTAYKTPTACAAAVVDHVRAAAARSEAAWLAVAVQAATVLDECEQARRSHAVDLNRGMATALVGAAAGLDGRSTRVGHLVTVGLGAAAGRAREASNRLTRTGTSGLRSADEGVARAARRLDPVRLDALLDRRRATLDVAATQVGRAARAVTTARSAALDVAAARTAAVDPARALARGWSITRTIDGALVRASADAPPGVVLRTTLSDGTIDSVVTDGTVANGDVAAPSVRPEPPALRAPSDRPPPASSDEPEPSGLEVTP